MEETPKRKPRKRTGDPNEGQGTGEATSLTETPTEAYPDPANGGPPKKAPRLQPGSGEALRRDVAPLRGGDYAAASLIRQAVINRYPTNEAGRKAMVQYLESLVADVDATDNAKLIAVRAYIAADVANLKVLDAAVAAEAGQKGSGSTTINIIRQQVNVTPGEQLQPGLVVDAEPVQAALPAPAAEPAKLPIDASPTPPNTSANTDGTS